MVILHSFLYKSFDLYLSRKTFGECQGDMSDNPYLFDLFAVINSWHDENAVI